MRKMKVATEYDAIKYIFCLRSVQYELDDQYIKKTVYSRWQKFIIVEELIKRPK